MDKGGQRRTRDRRRARERQRRRRRESERERESKGSTPGLKGVKLGGVRKKKGRGGDQWRRAFSHSGIPYASLPMIPSGILPLLEYHTVTRSSRREGVNSI